MALSLQLLKPLMDNQSLFSTACYSGISSLAQIMTKLPNQSLCFHLCSIDSFQKGRKRKRTCTLKESRSYHFYAQKPSISLTVKLKSLQDLTGGRTAGSFSLLHCLHLPLSLFFFPLQPQWSYYSSNMHFPIRYVFFKHIFLINICIRYFIFLLIVFSPYQSKSFKQCLTNLPLKSLLISYFIGQ